MICTTLERTSSPVALSTTRSCGLRRKALYDDPNDGATIQQVLTMRGIVEAAGEVTPGAMGHLVLPIPPLIAAGHAVDCPTVGDESRRAVHTVVTPEFLYRKRSALHSHLNSALLLAKGEAGDEPGLPPGGLRPYFRNFDTKGEVSPRREKWPDGPSPRNSENHDSCSISSLRMAIDRS